MLKKIKSHAVLIALTAILIIVLFIKWPFQQTNKLVEVHDAETNFVAAENTADETSVKDEVVVVDVKGAVKYPGVYEVASQSRVNDVILKAGGLADNANEQHVNLAALVYDEMVIFVPTDDEQGQLDVSIQGTNKIRVNQASAEELATLTGIGPSKAAAIINYRDEHGAFQSSADLLNVPGIGQKTLDNIVEDIQIP